MYSYSHPSERREKVFEENLFLELEFLKERFESLWRGLFEILDVLAAVGNHGEKSFAGVVVLAVHLEVFCELVNRLREESDLDGRRAGVLVVETVLLDNYFLFLCL